MRTQEICFLRQNLLPDPNKGPKQERQGEPSRYQHRIAGQRDEDGEEDWVAAEALQPARHEVRSRSFVNTDPPRRAEVELCKDEEYQTSKQGECADHMPDPGLRVVDDPDGQKRFRPSRRRDALTDEANDEHGAKSISHVLPPISRSEKQDA